MSARAIAATDRMPVRGGQCKRSLQTKTALRDAVHHPASNTGETTLTITQRLPSTLDAIMQAQPQATREWLRQHAAHVPCENAVEMNDAHPLVHTRRRAANVTSTDANAGANAAVGANDT
jgi:hypothetical protein